MKLAKMYKINCRLCKKGFNAKGNQAKFCYECRKIRKKESLKEWRQNNPDKVAKWDTIWRKNNRDKLKKYYLKYYKDNPEKMKRKRLYPNSKYRTYKANAKRRTIKFDLTKKQFMQFWQTPCYYCGIKVKTIGIDRVDNNKGYLVSNIVSCCYICNRSKSSMPTLQYIKHCQKVVDYSSRKEGSKIR